MAHRKVPAGQFVNQVCGSASGPHCVKVSTAAPLAFGPPTWNVLHTISEHYDDQQPDAQTRCAAWLSNVPAMLPCAECRGHMQQWVDQHPATDACASRDTLRTYMVDLHNAVNARVGGEAAWTPEQASERYRTVELCVD